MKSFGQGQYYSSPTRGDAGRAIKVDDICPNFQALVMLHVQMFLGRARPFLIQLVSACAPLPERPIDHLRIRYPLFALSTGDFLVLR